MRDRTIGRRHFRESRRDTVFLVHLVNQDRLPPFGRVIASTLLHIEGEARVKYDRGWCPHCHARSVRIRFILERVHRTANTPGGRGVTRSNNVDRDLDTATRAQVLVSGGGMISSTIQAFLLLSEGRKIIEKRVGRCPDCKWPLRTRLVLARAE